MSDSPENLTYREACDECGNITTASARQLAEGVLCVDCKTYPGGL